MDCSLIVLEASWYWILCSDRSLLDRAFFTLLRVLRTVRGYPQPPLNGALPRTPRCAARFAVRL